MEIKWGTNTYSDAIAGGGTKAGGYDSIRDNMEEISSPFTGKLTRLLKAQQQQLVCDNVTPKPHLTEDSANMLHVYAAK